eukprot:2875830-Amphidinium_carterae.1
MARSLRKESFWALAQVLFSRCRGRAQLEHREKGDVRKESSESCCARGMILILFTVVTIIEVFVPIC